MFGKFDIYGTIEVLSGMHIGGADAFAPIGAIDSSVVRDAVSNLPYIPGSSLKGKIRSLLAKEYETGSSNKYEDQDKRIVRLFGKSSADGGRNLPNSRVIFRDSLLSNDEELSKQDVDVTEIKMENNIDPLTAVANPRQIERVVRGSKFQIEIIYNAYDEETVFDDIELLAEGLRLLQYDYLGGHGSRGYGRVKITDISLSCVVGDDNGMQDKCNEIIQKVIL